MTRAVALLLTFLTGFSGLAYEVSWEKFLAILLGSHGEATAAVLGIFLGGLSVGYAVFGRVTRRLVDRARVQGREPRLLLAYGLVEGSIGLYVVCFPLLFELTRSVSIALPSGGSAIDFAVDVLLTAVLIGPPTVLMGGTIPLLTQGLARSVDDATRVHAWVYAFNTAGAFVGALAAGFVLVPELGLAGVMYAMGAINLAAGGTFVVLGRREAGVATRPARSENAIPGFATYAWAALAVGFAMMCVQTVSIRLAGLSLGSTQATFSMVVAVFVLCIALGSMFVSALPRVPKALVVAAAWTLPVLLYVLYAFLPEAPWWSHVLRARFGSDPGSYDAWRASVFLGLLFVLGAPVVVSGALLPLFFDRLKGENDDLGESAGRLYSWNTVGSLLGALLGGYALLFWLDLHHVYRVANAAAVVAAVLVTVRVTELRPVVAVGALLLLPLAALFLQTPWNPDLLSSGLYRERKLTTFTSAGLDAFLQDQRSRRRIVFYDDDPTVSAAVVDQVAVATSPVPRALLSNGKPDGSTLGDYTTMALAALLPATLVDAPERAFVIGYGTGVTVGELAMLESTKEVVVAEISAGVTAAAPLFDFANGGASAHPKVRIVRSDAYRALRRSAGDYDVIVSEPSNPWMAGVEMLYSREFLEAARSHLRPGGVYVQWLHQYESDARVLALVLRTYATVFDHVAVWYSQGSDLLLLGILDPDAALDLDAIARRIVRPDLSAGLRRAQIEGLPALLAHELIPVDVVAAIDWQGPLQTLRHPILNHLAGAAFFRGRPATLPFTGSEAAARVADRTSLLRRLERRAGGTLSDAAMQEFLREACRYRSRLCATGVAAWLARAPRSDAAHAMLELATRRAPRRFGGALDEEMIRSLVPLFGRQDSQAVLSLTAARKRRDAFFAFYQHAFPFDPEALRDLWRRCEPREASRCRGAEAAALRRLEGVSGTRSQPAAR